eukprot:gene31964-39487_t
MPPTRAPTFAPTATASPSVRPTYYTQSLSRIDNTAGNGFTVFNGDGLQATSSAVNQPHGVSGDLPGTVYFSELGQRVRQIDPNTGICTTVAGTGSSQAITSNNQATSAGLNDPFGVSFDRVNSRLFIADNSNNAIRVLYPSLGTMYMFAGGANTGSYVGEGHKATSTYIYRASSVYCRPDGTVYYSELAGNYIRRIDSSTNLVYIVAGSGVQSGASDSYNKAIGDGGAPTAATMYSPYQVYADTSMTVYFCDYGNNKLRAVNTAANIINTILGTGLATHQGDNGQATAAASHGPIGVYGDTSGVIYVCEYSGPVVRRIDPISGIVTTVIGTVNVAAATGMSTSAAIGDGGLAALAKLSTPRYLYLDTTNVVYVADMSNNKVRMVYAIKSANFATIFAAKLCAFDTTFDTTVD